MSAIVLAETDRPLSNIDISGFYFMEGDSDYEPDSALVEFLNAGKPPVYIG